jgi:NitT/TauT family transport system substrate-binding protein
MAITRRGLALGGLGLAVAAQRPARAEEAMKWMTLAAHFYMVPCFCSDNDIFKKNGLDIQVGISSAPPTLLPAVVSGAITVGVSTIIQVAMARENGLDVALLAGASFQIKGTPGTMAVARADSTISKPADFVGKRVVIPGHNGVYHVMFEKYLMDHGIDPDKVLFVEAGFAQAGDMLRNGSADVALSTEPFLSRLIGSGQVKVVADYCEPDAPNTYDSVFIVRSDWARDNQKTVAVMRQSMREGIAMMAKDRDLMLATEAKWLKLPPDVVAHTPPPATRIDISLDDIKMWTGIAKEVGLINKIPDPASLLA